ncbi:hypothetical protein CP533_6822 [Ophiocordyceps camponoti-saundersi (nom. inval.)]|nr:hypothetical protein CP533_6822 [Ophiocordyceps camponoti-saundersi (nom. inval.)]
MDSLRPYAAPHRPYRVAMLAAALAMTLVCATAQAVHPDCGTIRFYAGEKIGWKPCGEAKGREVECSDINVPMDQFGPSGVDGMTFNIPLIRMRGKNGTQNLVLNPGGPGESGLVFLHTDGASLHDVVGEDYHLLSFDPRGIGLSRPAAACYPTRDARRTRFQYTDPDSISQSVTRYAWTKNYVQSCADTMKGYGKYINTPQTAADMNSILDAVGQQRMLFWGFSYGSLLGQTYAQLYPDRSSRIIIDGVTDFFDWYEEPILRGDFVDTTNVLDGFLDECAKAGASCELAKHGPTKKELQQKLMGFLRDLSAHPMPVYVDIFKQGVLDYSTVLNEMIYSSLFAPSTWPLLARRLAQIMDGNATEVFLAHGDYDLGETGRTDGNDEVNDIVEINDGLSGPEHWPEGRKGLVNMLKPWYESSPFFFQMNREYYAKQQWTIEKGHDFVPKRKVRTTHPMLIISTTYDPICPLVSAKRSQETFENSSLIEIKGYGHCSLSLASLCMAKHLRRYLGNGTMPESSHTADPASSLPPPPIHVAAHRGAFIACPRRRIRTLVALMAALIDPTVRGKYPVILGDGMLGKTSNDIFTGPTLSTADGPAHARLKPSQPGKTTSYDLSYNDGGSAYAFAGTRSIDKNQYVLHFDPERKAFILDRIDSTFNMNLTRLPGNSDPAKLARQYPHLDEAKAADSKPGAQSPAASPTASPPPPPPAAAPAAPAPTSQPAGSGNARGKSAKTSSAKANAHPPRRKADKPQQKAVELSLPKPEPTPKPSPKKEAPSKPKPQDEEEEEDDDDGGLLVEYPGGNNATGKMTDFSPAFPPPRRFDDFMDQRDSEGDADGESDGEIDFDFKLPSPVNNPPPLGNGSLHRRSHPNGDDPTDDAAADDAVSVNMEDDLEKELENAFEDLANSQEGTPDGGDESEISEED